jgi:hypothetical protein
MGGAMIDVGIGVLLLFLVSSLIASAVVEGIGGYFRRRSKHLWDVLDLLLGNTSTADDPEPKRIVDELYRQPFITSLVRPTERAKLKDSIGGSKRARVRDPGPRVGRHDAATVDAEARARRFYGPKRIEPKEFANALLEVLRPGGTLDRAIAAVAALQRESLTPADVAIATIGDALDQLQAAAVALGSADLADAVARIRDGGETITSAELRQAVSTITSTLRELRSGPLSPAQLITGFESLPADLQTRLAAIIAETGSAVAGLRAGIEDWYARHMAAASEWYRKQTRYFLFAAGLSFAALGNIDAIHATTTLYRDKEARESTVAIAEQVGAVTCADDTPTTAPPTIDLDCVRDEIGGSISLPVGWDDVDGGAGAWTSRVVGWLLVALAVTLGAPFWFDLLRRGLDFRKQRTSANAPG